MGNERSVNHWLGVICGPGNHQFDTYGGVQAKMFCFDGSKMHKNKCTTKYVNAKQQTKSSNDHFRGS